MKRLTFLFLTSVLVACINESTTEISESPVPNDFNEIYHVDENWKEITENPALITDFISESGLNKFILLPDQYTLSDVQKFYEVEIEKLSDGPEANDALIEALKEDAIRIMVDHYRLINDGSKEQLMLYTEELVGMKRNLSSATYPLLKRTKAYYSNKEFKKFIDYVIFKRNVNKNSMEEALRLTPEMPLEEEQFISDQLEDLIEMEKKLQDLRG